MIYSTNKLQQVALSTLKLDLLLKPIVINPLGAA